MNFKVGDFVKIVRTGQRPTHQCVLNRVGKIEYIRHHAVNTPYEEITYFVSVDGIRNENQIHGWWFFDEKDLLYIGSPHNCIIVNEPKQLHCDSLAYVDYACQMIENRFKETKDMELLEIYKDKLMNTLEIKMSAKRERIKMKESVYKDLINYEKELKQLGNERLNACVVFNFDEYEFTPQTKRAIDKLSRDICVEKQKINKLISEIRAQLDMCDTYEQKQNILKAYKVIDDQGKLL